MTTPCTRCKGSFIKYHKNNTKANYRVQNVKYEAYLERKVVTLALKGCQCALVGV